MEEYQSGSNFDAICTKSEPCRQKDQTNHNRIQSLFVHKTASPSGCGFSGKRSIPHPTTTTTDKLSSMISCAQMFCLSLSIQPILPTYRRGWEGHRFAKLSLKHATGMFFHASFCPSHPLLQCSTKSQFVISRPHASGDQPPPSSRLPYHCRYGKPDP